MSTTTNATSPWALSNATVATVAGAPIGTWAEVTSTSSAGVLYHGGGSVAPSSSTTKAVSVWMAKASGSGSAGVYYYAGSGIVTGCTCLRSDGGTCSADITDSATICRASVSDLGTTPVRLTALAALSSASAVAIIGVQPGAFGVATGTTRFSGAQLEVSTYPTSLIVTTTTATARNADAISATVPAVPSKGWCISGNWKPTSGAWPNALSLWTLGDTYNAANRASSWGNSSLYIVDAASGVKDLGDYTDPVSPWKIVTCNANGSLSLSVNGVLVDSTSTGAGTGILTTPATTLHLGAQASAGTISDWYIKNVKVWSARTTKEASK